MVLQTSVDAFRPRQTRSAALGCKISLFLYSLSNRPKDSGRMNESTEPEEEKLYHTHRGSDQKWDEQGMTPSGCDLWDEQHEASDPSQNG